MFEKFISLANVHLLLPGEFHEERDVWRSAERR